MLQADKVNEMWMCPKEGCKAINKPSVGACYSCQTKKPAKAKDGTETKDSRISSHIRQVLDGTQSKSPKGAPEQTREEIGAGRDRAQRNLDRMDFTDARDWAEQLREKVRSCNEKLDSQKGAVVEEKRLGAEKSRLAARHEEKLESLRKKEREATEAFGAVDKEKTRVLQQAKESYDVS